MKQNRKQVIDMTEEELLDEIVDLIRTSRVHDFYDRKRFRVVATALKKLGFKLTP